MLYKNCIVVLQLVEFVIEAEKIDKETDLDINLLKQYVKRLEVKLKGSRKTMYSDVINLIAREGNIKENASKLIRWCGTKIKQGIYYINDY